MPLKLKLWGVRGSLPAPYTPDVMNQRVKQHLKNFVAGNHCDSKSPGEIDEYLSQFRNSQIGGYGGHTSCAEVTSDEDQLIIDGGSALRLLGQKMMSGRAAQGRAEIHVLLTHFHWDHLIGLPFFTPIFVPGNVIHFYAVQPELEEVIKTMFRKPFFPVPFEALGAKICFHRLEARQAHQVGAIKFTGFLLDHPDPCFGFRLETQGCDGCISYCVDTEGTRISRKEMGPDLPLYQDTRVLIFDAQYTLAETIERINWGHSAATIGLDIAIREKIPRVIFVHHDPGASDEAILKAELQTRAYYDNLRFSSKENSEDFFHVDWSFATEGMEIGV